jgi:hypothetical protein
VLWQLKNWNREDIQSGQVIKAHLQACAQLLNRYDRNKRKDEDEGRC